MIALDESRQERSFHGGDVEDGSQEKANLDDRRSDTPDTSSEQFGEQTDGNTDIEETSPEIKENEVPDGGWGWFIVLGCFVIKLICGGIVKSHGLFYIRFIDRYHQSATATAWVTSLMSTVRLGTGPVVSILCNRFTGRSVVLIGACIWTVSLMITAFAPNQPFLYFSYGTLGGLGRSFALTPLTFLLGSYFEKRRSLAFGLAGAGFSLGGFLITPLVALMFQNYGFTGTFIVLCGLATNIFVCACLFRPIEFQRRLLRKRQRDECEIPLNSGVFQKSQTLSIKSGSEFNHQLLNTSATDETIILEKDLHKNCNRGIGEKDKLQDDKIESKTADKHKGSCQRKSREVDQKVTNKKKKIISFSIVKDIRFLTFLLAAFCNSLPSAGLFLPALAVSHGLTEFEAAYLLSISAGTDTVFRVLAGLVLDMEVFRDKRPLIYNAMMFLRAVTMFLMPSMWSFVSMSALVGIGGMAQGIKDAQKGVVLVDLLGLDKLATSMALYLAVQAAGLLIGPTISGLLKDVYDSYDGAFYFGGSASLVGALIMAGGNIRKIYIDRQEEKKKNSNTADTIK